MVDLLAELPGLLSEPQLVHDFGTACIYVVFLTFLSFLISFCFDLHVGKDLAELPAELVTAEQRIDATDKVLLTPLFAVIGFLALTGSWELRGDVESRWHGETPRTRWCALLYCAKMLLDVPTQAYTLRGDAVKRLQMVGHHLLSFVAIGLGLVVKRSAFFACWAVCSELSTPFLNAVMAIKLFGGNATPAQKSCHMAAGTGLWLAYIPFRMALFPAWLWLWFDDQRSFPDRTTAVSSTFELNFFPAVIAFLLALSTVWFYAITKGLAKALGLIGPPKKKGP